MGPANAAGIAELGAQFGPKYRVSGPRRLRIFGGLHRSKVAEASHALEGSNKSWKAVLWDRVCAMGWLMAAPALLVTAPFYGVWTVSSVARMGLPLGLHR